MTEHPNATLLRKGYEAIARGDLPSVLELFAENGVMHVSGAGPLAGRHTGREAIGQAFAGLFAWTGGTVKLEIGDIFADDHHAIATVRESATRASDGLVLDVHEMHLFRMADGSALEFWDIPAGPDREAHEAFFAESPTPTSTSGMAVDSE
jgi:ketosteroid isomerase-like protein